MANQKLIDALNKARSLKAIRQALTQAELDADMDGFKPMVKPPKTVEEAEDEFERQDLLHGFRGDGGIGDF